MKLTFKEINMLYHTNIRNVGLFTSISLALLGQSRNFKQNKDTTSLVLFLLYTLVIQLIALFFVHNMLEDHDIYINNLTSDEKTLLTKWYTIPQVYKYLLLSLIILTVYRLFSIYY